MGTNNLCFTAKIMYTPVNPVLLYIKVGCKGVYIAQTCKHNVESVKQKM